MEEGIGSQHSHSLSCIQPLTSLLNCASKIDHYYNEMPQPGMFRFQLKGFLSDCCAHRHRLNLGELPLGRLGKTSTGLFDLLHFGVWVTMPHPNDDENWKRCGSPKKGLRKESHHFSEGDMGAKPQVLEGPVSSCPLGNRAEGKRLDLDVCSLWTLRASWLEL